MAFVLAAAATGCGGAARSGGSLKASEISPPPRSVRVEPESVVVEGHWFPLEEGPESPLVPNAVRVACGRADRSCKEELTRPGGEPRSAPVHEAVEYRIEEWTKWGTPAGKLVATRRDGGSQVEIRVSLSGLTAEKVRLEKDREVRWRIE